MINPNTSLTSKEYVMQLELQFCAAGLAAVLMATSVSGQVQAQSGRTGLIVVAPPITKQSTQNAIDGVRAGMKIAIGKEAKKAAKNAAKSGGTTAPRMDEREKWTDHK